MVQTAEAIAAEIDNAVRPALEAFGWGDVLDVRAYVNGAENVDDFLRRAANVTALHEYGYATLNHDAGLLALTDAGREALYAPIADKLAAISPTFDPRA